jgi:hypothetical protein
MGKNGEITLNTSIKVRDMTFISYYMFNTHLEWLPSSMNECASLLLRYKGAWRSGCEKGELAGTTW